MIIELVTRSVFYQPDSVPTTNPNVTIRPGSGSKPPSLKIKYSPCNAYVRPKPDAGKGTQNPPHFHIPLKGK